MRVECPLCGAGGPAVSAGVLLTHLVSCPACHEAYLVSAANGAISARPADPPAPLSARIAQGSVMEGVLGAIDESIRGLPTIPAATQRVIAAIHDPLTTTESLVKLIHEDATLSMRVLRLANSATFGGRQKITDLRLACARLGMRNLANVAHVVAQAHLYRSANPTFREFMNALWQHAVATARLAEAFGAVAGGVSQNTLFLMGLVHDIGKPVLLDATTNQYKGRIGRLKESPDLLLRALDDFAPYVGLRVAQYWNLSTEIRFATYYAGLPSAAPAAFRRHAYLVALSSAAAESAGYGAIPASRDPKAQAAELAEGLSQELGNDSLAAVVANADAEIKSHLGTD
jgi:HD-like signal output (HDOD) protein